MEFFQRLFDPTGFPARWQCGTAWFYEPHVGWMHIISDVIIWAAYVAIPLALAYFAVNRRDIIFPNVVWLFVAFILSCGMVHLLEATIFWNPLYRLSALLKVITAAVSVATVIALVRILPKAIHLPGLEELNQRLIGELQQNKTEQARLRQSKDNLESFARVTVGREERMIDLKLEVNALLKEMGRSPKYLEH